MSPSWDRRSLQLKRYDYSESGYDFVTICVQNRECLFGDVVKGEMKLNGAPRAMPAGLHERVIWNERELLETQNYVQENPLQWETDPENIFAVKVKS